MNNNFFNEFIINFFESIENDIENVLKKEKVKKLSVGKLGIDAIDYLDGSNTPIIETIKSGKDGIEIYIKNSKGLATPYAVEEIFHPFSLAALADALTSQEKYIKILENFYAKAEEYSKEFLEDSKSESFEILDHSFDVLAISGATGKFVLVEGVVTHLILKDERIFLNVRDDDGNDTLVHIIECSAADISMILNHIFFNDEE